MVHALGLLFSICSYPRIKHFQYLVWDLTVNLGLSDSKGRSTILVAFAMGNLAKFGLLGLRKRLGYWSKWPKIQVSVSHPKVVEEQNIRLGTSK